MDKNPLTTPPTVDPESAPIQIVDPTTIPGWDDIIARFAEATIFHTSAWAAVLKWTYGHRPIYRVLGRLESPEGVFPLVALKSLLTGRRGVCLPGADYCGPVTHGTATLRRLWETVRTEAQERRWAYVEVRDEFPLDGATSSITFHGHHLNLRPGSQKLFSGFDPAVRRAIRKAERAGVQVRFGVAPAHMNAYYDLHCMTRRRHGLPPQPKRFFDRIGEHVLRAGRGFIVLAYAPGSGADSPPLAALVFLHFGRHALYKFGASDLRHQEYRANNLVMWKGIERCVELGMDDLHFGRTNIGQEGLRRFKLAWGTSESPLHYHRFGVREGSWQTSRSLTTGWHNAVFRNLPLMVNRWLGGLAYRHMD